MALRCLPDQSARIPALAEPQAPLLELVASHYSGHAPGNEHCFRFFRKLFGERKGSS
jgi:hypothetical protein